MQYLIMNREDARRAAYVQDAPLTALISITDVGDNKNKFYEQSWLRGVLEVQFDDVEAGQSDGITKAQAKDIAKFVKHFYTKVDRFIIHCEFGQSRSAGVAAAIMEYYEGSASSIFESRVYYPNPICYKYVLAELRRKKLGMLK